MPLHLDSRAIKAEARSLLHTGEVNPFKLTLFYLLISLVLDTVNAGVSYAIESAGGFTVLSFSFVSILIGLVSLVLNAGYFCYCFGILRREQMPYDSLFDAFPFAGKVILLSIVEGIFIFLWSMLFVIPGIVAAYRYSFAMLNLCENPDLGVMEALDLSKRQTNGYKMQLFLLQLSFIGYQLAAVMKMQPIMGALLGAIMISSSISGAEGLDFLGIPIPTNDYSSTVVPIVLGVVFMYFVDRGLQKIIPDITKLFLKPLLTMFIVVPVELIILGPAGSMMGYALSDAATWLMDNVAFIATPILAALNPYFVMLGLDKAYIAIEVTSLAQLGWAPIIFGFISNLCIGGTSLALATAMKGNKEKRGMVTTVAVTALCGVTEPAFYGCLIERPRLLVGTAIGALCAGLPAGIFVLKEYVAGACPGLLSALIFIAPDGSMGNFVLACVVAVIAIVVSFIAARVIIKKNPNYIE